ncbi:MAG TPA: hypothetical protein PK102_02280, partial [bacterium]|nr:hypothetical protein [bacterium]
MLSLIFSLLIAVATGLITGFINYGFGVFIGLFAGMGMFIFFTRFYSKKLQDVFTDANTYIQKQQFDKAISILRSGYKYNNHAFLVKAQIDSQIGII